MVMGGGTGMGGGGGSGRFNEDGPLGIDSQTGMPLPDRPGQLPCQFYMKTGKCKYGWQCKFDHPKSQLAVIEADKAILAQNPGAENCSFYMRTGKCKYGGTCKFHHPLAGDNAAGGQGQQQQQQASQGGGYGFAAGGYGSDYGN
jgi:hypothetical protein